MTTIPQSEIGSCTNPAGWQIVGDKYGPTKPLYRSADGWCKPYSYDGSVDEGMYNYDPSMAAGVAFFTLFALGTLIYAFLTIRSRRWFLVVGVLFGLFEAVGWIGRLMSGIKNDMSAASRSKFLLQIICLTFAPAFASAAIYGIFIVLVRLKPTVSRISPKRLAQLCIAIDVVSLVIQATGGGIAGSADTQSQADTGGHIMLAGIVFQLFSMILFVGVALIYYFEQRRAPYEVVVPHRARPSIVWLGLAFASILVILRGAYRTAELSEGWNGYLNSEERWFLAMDAAAMLVCLWTLVATHLALWLPPFEGRQARLDSTPDSMTEKTHV